MLKMLKISRQFVICLSTFVCVSLSADSNSDKNDFPVHISTAITNSVGIGTFVSGYQKMPNWSTDLSLSPSYSPPKIAGTVPSSLSLHFSLSLEWLKSYAQSASNEQMRVQYSDISLAYSVPKLLNWKKTGLYISPSIALTGPISIYSRASKRVLGYRAGVGIGWSKGDITIGYSPSFSGWLYSSTSSTIPCGQNIVSPNPNNFSESLDDVSMSLAAFRSQDSLGDGQCRLSGRQTLGTVANSIAFSWSPGDHNVTIQLGWHIGFLRPLVSRPDIQSPFAKDQNFTETSSGLISYTYSIPIDLEMSVTLGLASFQSALTQDGRIRFPFVDFISAGNNHSQIFLEWSMRV